MSLQMLPPHSLTLGIEHGLTVVVVVSAGMLLLTFLLKDVPLRTSHGPAEPVQQPVQPVGQASEQLAAQHPTGS
jgi:hypothetical protein